VVVGLPVVPEIALSLKRAAPPAKGITVQASEPVRIIEALPYCATVEPAFVTVTPEPPAIVTEPAPKLATVKVVPVAQVTEDCGGIVKVTLDALFELTTLAASARTNV
jgi:hypothetical protein